MTVGEFIELIREQNIDPETILYFGTTIEGPYYSPCPAECASIELGPLIPYVDEEGNLVTPEEDFDPEDPIKGYVLLPHDPQNPHTL